MLNILTGFGLVISLGYYQNIIGLVFIDWSKINLAFAFECMAIIFGLIITIQDQKSKLTLFVSGILVLSLLKNNNIYLFLSIVLAISSGRNGKVQLIPFVISTLYFLNLSFEFNSIESSWSYNHFIQVCFSIIFLVRNIPQLSLRNQNGLMMFTVFLLDLTFVTGFLLNHHIENSTLIAPIALCFGLLIIKYKSVVQRSVLLLGFYIVSGSAFEIFNLSGYSWIALYLIVFPMIFSFIEDSHLNKNYRILLNFLMAISFVSAQLYLIKQVATHSSLILASLFVMCIYLQLRAGLEQPRLVTNA